MIDSSCARQRARSSIFSLRVTISYHVSYEIYSLKVPLRVLVASTSWVGRSVGTVSIFMEGYWSNFGNRNISFLFNRFLILGIALYCDE
jgi:hypothetical protein